MPARPKSLFTARKAAFLIGGLNSPSFVRKPSASILKVGEIRKIQGLPEVVIFGDEDVSTSIGRLFSSSKGMTERVKLDPQAPISTGTWSRRISRSAAVAESRGVLFPSPAMRVILRPSTPPSALILAAAMRAPSRTYCPETATSPVSG